MSISRTTKNVPNDLLSFGLASEESDERITDDVNFTEVNYSAINDNELFANENTKTPWWKSQFFVSQPVLFGMWDGVFTSCLINIFGVIVFLRSGWVVSQAGIVGGVLVVTATVGIALTSVLSAIGICERCRMESGGVYFLLAHVLGPRLAAAIGILYVFGQAVGCALNLLGFGESVAGLLGLTSNKWVERGFASVSVILLWFINLIGVKWVVKLQFVLLVILLLAGLDFAVGSFVHTNYKFGFNGWTEQNLIKNMFSEYTQGYSWFTVFAVFFPSVTGVMAGINMSGDLSHPSRDIPNGTLAALATGFGLYLVFITFLGGTCSRWALRSDFNIVAKVSAVRVLLLAGIYISSMSSCLGAMYGTPRVLQSIANERVIPVINFLARGRGPNKVPVFATAVVAIIVVVFTLVGDINSLAPIVTMPFLFTYAALDYAYFALAQTFNVQHQKAQRLQRSTKDNEGTVSNNANQNNLLSHLFPERTTLPNSENNGWNGIVHSKTSNWYSSLCNRWLSLFGAILNIIIMCIVDKTYAATNIVIVFIIWCYIGLANPAVKPGVATSFKFLSFLRKSIVGIFWKKQNEYEEIIVIPLHENNIQTQQSQLTQDNEDFAYRERFHQTASIQTVI